MYETCVCFSSIYVFLPCPISPSLLPLPGVSPYEPGFYKEYFDCNMLHKYKCTEMNIEYNQFKNIPLSSSKKDIKGW